MRFGFYLSRFTMVVLCFSAQLALADDASIPSYTPNTSTASQLPSRQPGLVALKDKTPDYTMSDADQQYKRILQRVQAMQKQRQASSKQQDDSMQSAAAGPSSPAPAPIVDTPKTAASASKPEEKVSSSDIEFIKMLKNMNPLTPDQIKMMHAMYTKTQQATNYPNEAQTPSISSINVSLQPNAAPPVISLSPGIVTSVVFLDSTGQPWPIKFFDIGNSKDYDAKQTAQSSKGKLGSNTLLLQSQSNTARPGNIAVMLQGNSTPIMLALSTNQKVINYRVDLHIPGSGPNALSSTDSTLAPMSNNAVMTALNGTAPNGAKPINLDGCPTCQAWRAGNYLYLRTKRRLLSPSWISQSQSADGTHAYKVQLAPILLTYLNGKIARINVTY